MFGIAQLERSPVVAALLVVVALAYLAQQAGPSGAFVTEAGLLWGPAVAEGQWWRLASWGFLHANLLHVGFNGFLLFALGPQLERAFGSVRFALIYLGSLFAGALAVIAFDWSQPTLGASGAVLGTAAALALALWLRGADLRQTPTFGLVVVNLALPLVLPGISFWGHAGGAVGGAAMAWLLVTGARRSPALVRASAQSLAFGTGAVVGLAALALLAGQALRG